MEPPESETTPPTDGDAPSLFVSPTSWPPRIPASFAPGRIRIRDFVLTLMAWLVYAWILRQPVVALVTWLSPSTGAVLERIFGVTLGIDIRPFLWIAAGLVAWLVSIGVLQKQRLRRQPSLDNVVPALPLEDQFAAAGVPYAQIALLHGSRRLRIDHDEQGRIVRIESEPALEGS
jgi:poly-beta-1,6-N-acetyl-D-glucosamine biosynthesis protein PgaD